MPAQTYVGARNLRYGDAIWELPTTQYVLGMLNEHGLQDSNPVVTPAVNRNDDDDDEEDASAEEHRTLRRIVGKCEFLVPRRPDIAFATNRLPRSLAKPSKTDIIASKRLLQYLRGTLDLGLKLQVRNKTCSMLTVFSDSDCVGDRPTRKSVSSWGDHAGWILAQRGGTNTVGGCSVFLRSRVHRTHCSHERGEIHPGVVLNLRSTRHRFAV